MAIEKKLRSPPGYGVLTTDVSSLVNEAFSRASTVETAKNAFRKSGIWPLDRNVFTEADFAATTVYSKLLLTPNLQLNQNHFLRLRANRWLSLFRIKPMSPLKLLIPHMK